MMYVSRILLISFFSFFTLALSAQIPDPTGSTEWDYCECVEGIQAWDDLCPCPQTYPPSGGSGWTNTPPSGSNGSPTGSSNGGGGATTANEFFTMMRELFCEANPHLCD